MNDATDYGNFYWCVKCPKAMSKSGEIYVFADEVQFPPDGSVLFLGYGWDNSVHPHVKKHGRHCESISSSLQSRGQRSMRQV